MHRADGGGQAGPPWTPRVPGQTAEQRGDLEQGLARGPMVPCCSGHLVASQSSRVP